MDSTDPIRLLVVDRSAHVAEFIVSHLRSSGLHARADHLQDPEAIRKALEATAVDVVLCDRRMEAPGLAEVGALVAATRKPIALLALCDDPSFGQIIEAMRHGARDLVSIRHMEHLARVLTREAAWLTAERDRSELARALEESEQRSEGLLSATPDAVAYVHEGVYLYANAPYLELFGIEDFDDIEATSIMDSVAAADQTRLKTALRAIDTDEAPTEPLEMTLRRSDDSEFTAQIEIFAASYDGEPCIQILIRDRADTKALEEQIQYLSEHDQLTDLFNRQYYTERVREAVAEAAHGQPGAALLHIEMDNFQSLKDGAGIAASDLLLKDVAGVLKQGLGDKVVTSRYGAHAFAALYRGIDPDKARAVAEGLRVAVEKHICEVDGKSLGATCSIGVCAIEKGTPPDPYEVITRAERACGQVRARGGNGVVVYVPEAGEMTAQEQDRVWIDKIRDVIKNDRLGLLFQPVVSLHGIPGERYEATAELRDADGGVLAPEDYARAADRSGLAKAIDRWVIGQAIRTVAGRQAAGETAPTLFIKLSAGSLMDEGLMKWTGERLAAAEVPGNALVMEVKEGSVVNHLKEAKAFAAALARHGCQFCLDDFGAGVNPFLLLKHVRPDYLKVDAAFSKNLADNPENQATLQGIASTSREHGLATIVQEVADAASLSVLFGMGVDYTQGSFLQEPGRELGYDFASMGG